MLSVSDDGVGMDGGPQDRSPSSGLGTRFVEAFVQQIGGSLARASGRSGTTVTVHLPGNVLAE